MDAQSLFWQGVAALRDQHDAALAQKLLIESLKLNPDNELAWLWLSRTTNDRRQKLEFVERALRLDPENQMALALKEKLGEVSPPPPTAAPPPAAIKPPAKARPTPRALRENHPPTAKAVPTVGTPRAASPPPVKAQPIVGTPTTEIDALLAEAEQKVKVGDAEAALDLWLRVLEVQVDHPVAMQNAVRSLFKLGYAEDARELLWRAVNADTPSVPVYLTAIDLARHLGNQSEADDLRDRVARLPNADEDLILEVIDHFAEVAQPHRAADVLASALESRPNSQPLLMRMADLQEETLGDKAEALSYYERAARLKSGSKEGKLAEKVLRDFTPVMTDRERGSISLALREALGFGAVYLLMGWQDAGLNLLNLGGSRWLGVGLSVLGGYLLVTALSAPQQRPFAGWFGGKVPANPPPKTQKQQMMAEDHPIASGPAQAPTALPILPSALRALFALAGLIVLVGAFLLVFTTSIQLLRAPVPPYVPSIHDLLSE